MDRRYEKYRTHHRSRRLAGHDYAAPGWYFVTICTNDRACFFGAVRGGIMGLSDVGMTAHRCWAAIPDHFGHARLDAYVVMPNHVHGLIGLLPQGDGDANNDAADDDGASLGVIVNQYKGAVTRWARNNGHPDFAWQPRFHDHIVRNERSLQRIRRYIFDNPLAWEQDENHPANWHP